MKEKTCIEHCYKCGKSWPITEFEFWVGSSHECETEESEMAVKRTEQKAEFIRALAEYFAGDQAHKSILLEMGKPEAVEWAKLRNLTPLFGYPTVEEAEKQLTEFLG